MQEPRPGDKPKGLEPRLGNWLLGIQTDADRFADLGRQNLRSITVTHGDELGVGGMATDDRL